MKQFLIFLLFVCLISFSISCKKSVAPSPDPIPVTEKKDMLYWAKLLVDNIPVSNNDYVQPSTGVQWKDVGGATSFTCHTDCSGFVCALITQVYGYSPVEYKAWLNVNRPASKTYFDGVKAQNKFKDMQDVSQVEAGDLMFIKFDGGPDQTGHSMLICKKPALETSINPIMTNTKQWSVEIYDCSESGHGKTDTRYISDNNYHRGVGKGLFRIYTDMNNHITGYSWIYSAGSVYYSIAERDLVIGRLLL